MNAGGDTQRIKGFDGLRAIAALMVWIEHRTSLSGDIGSTGVGLFFVLSGFLIVNILRKHREKIERHESTFTREWKHFVVRRAYRIFPVCFLFLAITIPLAVYMGNQGMDLTGILMHVFYLVNLWVSAVFGHWNHTTTHLWSLAIEEQFYVFFPIIALMMPSRWLPHACATIIAAGLGAAYFASREPGLFASQLILHGFCKIAVGGFLVLVFARTAAQSGTNSLPATIGLAGIILLPILAVCLNSPLLITLFDWTPATLLTAIIVLNIYRNQASPLVRLLETWPVRGFGVISYGFYMYHVPLNDNIIGHFLGIDISRHLPAAGVMAFNFLIPLAAAIASWRYMEKPILAWRSWTGRSIETPDARRSPTASIA